MAGLSPTGRDSVGVQKQSLVVGDPGIHQPVVRLMNHEHVMQPPSFVSKSIYQHLDPIWPLLQ